MTEVDALLFDLDGTLIDSTRDLAESVRHVQAHYQCPLSSDSQVAAFIGDGIVKLVERAVPGFTGPKLHEAVDLLKAFYRTHCLDHTRLLPGVNQVLEHYRTKTLTVVTNKPERVSRRILKGLGIDGYFKSVLGGDSRPTKKPDPEPLLWVLNTFQVPPRRAVMVGDGPNDVLAGRAAGIWTASIRSTISHSQPPTPHKADIELLNLADLMRFFN